MSRPRHGHHAWRPWTAEQFGVDRHHQASQVAHGQNAWTDSLLASTRSLISDHRCLSNIGSRLISSRLLTTALACSTAGARAAVYERLGPDPAVARRLCCAPQLGPVRTVLAALGRSQSANCATRASERHAVPFECCQPICQYHSLAPFTTSTAWFCTVCTQLHRVAPSDTMTTRRIIRVG